MIRALIFDCDGVIADTEPAHYAMFNRVLRGRGFYISRRTYDRAYLALNDRDCFKAFSENNRLGWSDREILACAAEKAGLYGRFLREGRVKIYPGVRSLIRDASGKAQLAVCSGALRNEVEHILRASGLARYFPVIVAADDVKRGKPSPEGFRLALEKLNRRAPFARRRNRGRPAAPRLRGIEPGECVVIEDSPPGIEAAGAAGMRCIGVTNSYPAIRLGRADWVVRSLAGVRWRHLNGRFSIPNVQRLRFRPRGYPEIELEAGPAGLRRVSFLENNRKSFQAPVGAIQRDRPMGGEHTGSPLQGRVKGRISASDVSERHLDSSRRVLECYLQGGRVDFGRLKLDLSALTPFQKRVLHVLPKIPRGEVRSYGWVAARLHGVGSPRAVGQALSANPLPIILPCHRVVASDGSIGGFSGGVKLKRSLLGLER